MIDFFQMIASGIAVGSSYALMGIAMVIIYKTSEVPNFAQGEMALISSFFAFMLLDQYGLPYHLAFPAALVFSVLLGFFLEFAILRRAKEPNILGMIVITIGIEMILLGLVSWKFGADPKTMPFPISPWDSVAIGEVFISGLEILTLVVALIIMVILFIFLRYSKLGVAMKATQQNNTAARIMGIRTHRILMTTTTEDGGRLNMFAIEPPMEIIEVYETHNEKAERLNGRLAMLGVIAAIGAYAVTGQLIPGVF